MRLLKVNVPNFRNLQNVELTFEPDLSPAVFPIASQNGGRKSTLLQLIFTLFHCGINPDRHRYISNLFNTSQKLKDGEIYNIANFHFLYKGKIIAFKFNIFNFSSREALRESSLLDILESDREYDIFSGYHKTRREVNQEHNFIYSLYWDSQEVGENIADDSKILFCSINNEVEYNFAVEAFTAIGENIFLAAPSTQPFLFLDKSSKKELFNNLSKYCEILVANKADLSNFYLYSQLTIAELIETFKKARDQDWQEGISSDDLSYGSKFKMLVDDFHDFLGNDKYILPTSELDSIVVQKQISEIKKIELDPEDLSHGELRRLGLYAWVKYNIPENSIILIDEVENALHPDWQYNIADELASWGNNQYLLATHSFHLCEALTPKHVKEIEPKMSKPDSKVD
ncbi:MAG: AAA family ATPase [Cyanobacteria bacterium J06621_8]